MRVFHISQFYRFILFGTHICIQTKACLICAFFLSGISSSIPKLDVHSLEEIPCQVAAMIAALYAMHRSTQANTVHDGCEERSSAS